MIRLIALSCALLPLSAAGADSKSARPTRVIPPELVNRQPVLIDEAVARIAQQSEPGAQLYFLGFAAYGDERVFAEEIELAEHRVAERYGAARRSLRLVNDHRNILPGRTRAG